MDWHDQAAKIQKRRLRPAPGVVQWNVLRAGIVARESSVWPQNAFRRTRRCCWHKAELCRKDFIRDDKNADRPSAGEDRSRPSRCREANLRSARCQRASFRPGCSAIRADSPGSVLIVLQDGTPRPGWRRLPPRGRRASRRTTTASLRGFCARCRRVGFVLTQVAPLRSARLR
jgi:hypothetical protein